MFELRVFFSVDSETIDYVNSHLGPPIQKASEPLLANHLSTVVLLRFFHPHIQTSSPDFNKSIFKYLN